MTVFSEKNTPAVLLRGVIAPRWLLLVSAGLVLHVDGPSGSGIHLLTALLAVDAVGVYLLPAAVLAHPRFEWSLFLADGILVAICLLVASPSEPVLLGLYFLSILIAVLASGSPGWTLAGLAVPGLFVALKAGGGASEVGSLAVVLRAMLLTTASYYFLFAIRRLNNAASVLQKVRRESRELWALLEITDTITSTLDLRRVMTLIVRRVSELVGAESCSILLADEKLRNCFVVASNDHPDVDMLEIDLNNYPELRRALETREPVVVEDIERDPLVSSVRKLLIEKGYRSMMVLPLLFGREVLGTLFLRASRERPFNSEEIRFCKVAAGASANALKNALLFEDVTREAERHRATGEKLRRVLDCTPDLIIATDQDGRITEFNGGAEKITGLTGETARGDSLAALLGEPALEQPAMGEAADGVLRKEIVFEARDGDDREVSLVSAPLIGSEGEGGRVWIGRDVTHVRRVERSLAQVERLSTLGEIVAGVAHELNNPLSAVLGYGELMRKNAERDDHARDLDRVVESARRCKRIVQNLLGFARRQNPEKRYDNLNACVRKLLDLKSYNFKTSKIKIVLDLDPDLSSTYFDHYQMEQVLINLVNNAEQSVREGGGGTIVVRTYAAEDSVHLEIEDDGPGIPNEIRSRIFDPFFTTKEVGKGTGLGLSVSFGIVQEHGGSLELRSPLQGQGARFHLRLPLIHPSAKDVSVATETPCDRTEPLRGRRILVAEDEPMVLDFFSRVLEQDGVQVTCARDGKEAWEKIASADFDLVVADLRMPRMDGQELYERVAEERPEMLRRIVFSSGDLVRPESLAFLQSLPNRLLAKPLQVETVRHVLSRALQQAGFRK